MWMESSAFGNTIRWINCYSLGSKSGEWWMNLLLRISCGLTGIIPLCLLLPFLIISKLEIMDRNNSSASVLSPKPSHSFVLFICSRDAAHNCGGHANPHSTRLEATSANVFLGEVFCVLSSSEKVIFLKQIAVPSVPRSIFSCFWGKHIWKKTSHH